MTGRPARDRIRGEVERQLSPAEAEAYLDAPITVFEEEETLALIRWFRRRYSTPLERSAYIRQAYARWQQTVQRSGAVTAADTSSPDTGPDGT